MARGSTTAGKLITNIGYLSVSLDSMEKVQGCSESAGKM